MSHWDDKKLYDYLKAPVDLDMSSQSRIESVQKNIIFTRLNNNFQLQYNILSFLIIFLCCLSMNNEQYN